MKSFAKSLLLLIAILSLYSASAQMTTRRIQTGFDRDFTLLKGEARYMNLEIDQVESGFDLAIVARPESFRNDPDLFVSTINKFPNSTATSTYSSTSYGYSSIYIPSSEIIEGQTIYLGVVCASNICNFNLTVDYAKDYYLKPSYNDLSVQFLHLESLVLRVGIPPNSETDRILFSVGIDNEYAVNEEVYMWVNQGNVIPDSTNHQITAELAWMDGKASVINSNSPYFCTDCNYTVVIQAPIGALVEFHKTLYGSVIDFSFDTSRYDAVQAGKNVTYKVDLSNVDNLDNETVIVEVTPYFGAPAFLVSLNTLPVAQSEFNWEMNEFGVAKLSITPDERALISKTSKTLYVVVKSWGYASFFITIKGRTKMNNHIYIGEFENGYALSKEMVGYNFIYEVSVNTSLTFNLHQLGGGNSDLYIKQCPDKDTCYFNASEAAGLLNGEIKTSDTYPMILFSNVQKGDQHLAVNLDPSKCDNDPTRKVHTCLFSVMVNNEDDKTSHYSLIVDASYRLTALMIGNPVKHHLDEGENKYYYYTVTNDTEIAAISFQLTEIAGYVMVFASMTERYPDASNCDEVIIFDDKITYSREKFANLEGTFYLGALGATSATFTLVPIITYVNQTVDTSNMIALSQGVPQKASLTRNSTGLYVVKTYYEPSDNIEAMEIVLDNLQGAVQICINNNNTAPVFGQCEWMTTGNKIIIYPTDENFEFQGTYIVAVFPRIHSNGSWDTTFSYSISYTTLMHFNDLMTGYAMMTTINNNRTAFYKFLLYPETDTEATLILSMEQTEKANIFISSNALGLTNETDYNYTQTGKGTVYLTMNQEQIKDFCSMRQYSYTKCYAYVALTTDSVTNVYPFITLRKDFTEMKVTEGNEVDFLFPDVNHTLKFYYYPYKMEDTTIVVNSYSRALKVFVNVIDTSNYLQRSSWPYPSSANYDYTDSDLKGDSDSTEILVPAVDFSACGTDDMMHCAILITVQSFNTTWTSGDFDDCAIVVTQSITPVKFGVPIKSSVAENAYKYFKLKVDKDTAELLISLTLLTEGDAWVFIDYGENKRPTWYNFEYCTVSGTSETIQLGNEDLIYQGSMAGYWILAVYGSVSIDFTLTVIYEDHPIIDLNEYYPQAFELAKSDITYFDFYMMKPKDIKIILSPQYGSASFYVNVIREEDNLVDRFPNATNAVWKGDTSASRNVIEIKHTDPNLGMYCTVMIGIVAHDDLKATVTISGPEAVMYITPGNPIADYCAAGSANKYTLTMAGNNVDIDVLVHANSPQVYVSHNSLVNSSNFLWKFDGVVGDGRVIKMKIDNSEYVGRKDLPPAWDGKKNVSSDATRFYIYVTSDLQSNYTITASKNNVTTKVYDGYLASGFLNPEESNTYTYISTHNMTSKHRVKAVLTVYRDEFSEAMDNVNAEADIRVLFRPKASNGSFSVVDFVANDEVNALHGPVMYRKLVQFIADNGTFDIEVNNKDSESHLNYTFVINGHQPFPLPLDTFYVSRLMVGDSDKFIIHAGQAGDVVLQIFECFGKVGIEVSKSPSMFKQNIMEDLEENADVNLYFVDQAVKYIKVPVDAAGTVYVKVNSYDGLKDNNFYADPEAVYKIQASLFPRGKAPLADYIFPGGDGELHYEMYADNQLAIQFTEPTVLFSSGNPAVKAMDLDFRYDLFVANSDHVVNSLAKCDILPNSIGVFGKDNTKYYNQSFKGDELKVVTGLPLHTVSADVNGFANAVYATMRVTVYGLKSDGSVGWSYPVVYNTIQANMTKPPNHLLYVLLFSSGIVLVGVIVGLVIYVKKYKRVKARLMYETQDIRNVAASVNNEVDFEKDDFEKEIERGPKKDTYIELGEFAH